MSEENRKDEEEEWEVEEYILGVSNIDNDEGDMEELLEQNIIPEEEWETEEHIAGVPNIEFYDRSINALPIERDNVPEEIEEIEEEQEKIEIEFETEEHIVGVSNLTEDDIIPEEVIDYGTNDEEEFSEELINTDDDVIKEGTQSLMNNKMESPYNNGSSFREIAIMEIIRQIKEENKKSSDFDSDTLIDIILINLGIPHNKKMIDKSNFPNKRKLKHRLQRKRDFIRQYGKIIVEILDLSKNSTQTEIANKYGVSSRTIVRLVKYLETRFKLNSRIRFKHSKKDVRRKVSEGQRDWSFLDYDDMGQPLSRENTLQKLVIYLLNNFEIIDSTAPLFEYISIKDPSFINAYRDRCFKWQEILEASDLKSCFKNWSISEEYSDLDLKYSTLELIEDLKREIGMRISNYISHKNLSEILGQKKSHIKSILEYCRRDSGYLLTKSILKEYKSNLRSKFKDSKVLEFLIDRYEDSNTLSEKRQMIDKYHPNLELDFFKVINTKKKSYWFGLLYAEGSLSKIIYRNGNYNLSLSLEVAVHDAILIKKFIDAIGFNPKYVSYKKRKISNINTGETRIIRSFRVRFSNVSFCENMRANGFIVGKKADKIRFPNLERYELELAFLLGFFDGDGRQGTSIICSTSKLFIEDIKSRFKLSSKITITKYLTKSGIEKDYHELSLGADLFNEMLDNYQDSLPRKRIRFIGTEKGRELMIPSRITGAVKFKFSKEELKKLVSIMPLYKLVDLHKDRFGILITSKTISYWCKKWNIRIPKDKDYFPFEHFNF
ncbi:MAG: hypothetical protein EU548_06710 [Promethearchaeota archaeon]|nr:MAG: hypothetical protein EU548_06710 [Candidatus Lokiarchaeota archaeon]